MAEKKIEIEAKSKKLSTFLSFHNTSDLAEYFGGKLWRLCCLSSHDGLDLRDHTIPNSNKLFPFSLPLE